MKCLIPRPAQVETQPFLVTYQPHEMVNSTPEDHAGLHLFCIKVFFRDSLRQPCYIGLLGEAKRPLDKQRS